MNPKPHFVHHHTQNYNRDNLRGSHITLYFFFSLSHHPLVFKNKKQKKTLYSLIGQKNYVTKIPTNDEKNPTKMNFVHLNFDQVIT